MAEGQQHKLELTPEELNIIKQEQRRGFFTTQLPLTFGSTYGTYMLMKRGILKKSGAEGGPAILAYVPRCTVAFFLSLGLASTIVASKIGRKLMQIDGNYSRMVRQRQGNQPMEAPITPPFSSTSNDGADISVQNEKHVLDSVLNPRTDELPPRQSLTYDDLRRKSRMDSDGSARQQPIQPRQPLPYSQPTEFPKKSKDMAPGSNKYGDEWAET
ncbi:uncharacterized protein [Watersipora subatra]|uniref:uncharacterized protein n=1 Tax=Watersipora subatra TaxID=2589382 RepID=UPI00355BAD49